MVWAHALSRGETGLWYGRPRLLGVRAVAAEALGMVCIKTRRVRARGLAWPQR